MRQVARLIAAAERQLAELAARVRAPEDDAFAVLETNLFALAPLVAASERQVEQYGDLINRVRRQVKGQSERWDFGTAAARKRLYRLLFGSRMAVEEVLLQLPAGRDISAECDQEPSQTPAVQVRGVTLQYG